MPSATARKTQHLRVVKDKKSTDVRLRECFPEIDFEKIVGRGAFNHHNLSEKWDALTRQVDWWLNLADSAD